MVIFRVDFGGTIGLGHLMRSLVYAKNFDEVIFISKSDKQEFLEYPLTTIKDEDEFFIYIKKINPQSVVVDNYDFTYKNEKKFKKLFPNIKLSVFDDDYREHFCDEIINHNISADINKYKNQKIVKIIPPLIREEFHQEKNIQREKIYDIFIAIGGTDSTNINIPILKAIPSSLHIALITTNANNNIKELKKFIKSKKNISLHVNSKNIARLINQSKFAIITPSVIVHEIL
jgi:UDP-2,4-diacetamido-2,4,6-trideoxy-beta-L-altropyranose hydrolase